MVDGQVYVLGQGQYECPLRTTVVFLQLEQYAYAYALLVPSSSFSMQCGHTVCVLWWTVWRGEQLNDAALLYSRNAIGQQLYQLPKLPDLFADHGYFNQIQHGFYHRDRVQLTF